jgi:hypothetical protein
MADYATNYGTNVGQSVVDYGLGAAKDALAGTQTAAQQAMPAWYGSQRQGPVQSGYNSPYVANASPYQTQNFQQVSDALRGTATDAYNRSLTEGDNRYGANGLYGSQGQGMQSDYMGQAQKTYQQGLLNADAQAMQLADQSNQFGWKAGATDAATQQAYNDSKFAWDYGQQQQNVDWNNQQLADQYSYDLAKRTDAQNQAQRQFENPLALATGANPNASANLNASTSANNAALQNKTSSTNALYTGLGGLAGGLLSAKTSNGGSVGGSLASGIWDGAQAIYKGLGF